MPQMDSFLGKVFSDTLLNREMEKAKVEGIGMQDTFASFLQDFGTSNLAEYSGKKLLETEVLRVMRQEGFTEEQIYEMPLEKLLDIFYNAYLWSAERILSKAQSSTFIQSKSTSRRRKPRPKRYSL